MLFSLELPKKILFNVFYHLLYSRLLPEQTKRQWSGTDTIEHHILSKTSNGKRTQTIKPCHEIVVLFVLHKLILQSHVRSHPVGLDVWFFVGPFVYSHTSCVRRAKALARLRGCAGSPESSRVAYVISTIISWAGSIRCLVWKQSLLVENVIMVNFWDCFSKTTTTQKQKQNNWLA